MSLVPHERDRNDPHLPGAAPQALRRHGRRSALQDWDAEAIIALAPFDRVLSGQ
jgi:hypothetical protein